jgi:EmrB/QacA subfamily drug resistance transporter
MLNARNRKWWVLAAMVTTISMIFIDVTVLPVALPTILRELDTSELAMQWLISAYLLSLTVFLLAGGRLGDMFGYRYIFCWGIFVFSIASALCGLSQGDSWFIASRALQGVGGALLLPSTGAILFSTFPPEQRGRASGIYVSIGSIFLASGPFIGGVFTEYLSWRYVFWINLPIAAIGLLLALYSVPRSKKKKESFDFVGFFTLAFGISCIVFAFMQSSVWGWDSFKTIAIFVVGILCVALLFFADREIPHPFVDFSIFRSKLFLLANVAILIAQFLIMVRVFWAIYFQNILGYSPAAAGGIAFIANAPVLVVAPLAGFLTDRFGPKPPVIAGFILTIFSLIWLVNFDNTQNLLMLLPMLIAFGCGMPLILTPSSVSAMSQASPQKRGIANGISSTLRQLGATLGMALFGSLFLKSNEKHLAKLLKSNPDTAMLNPLQFEGLTSRTPSALNNLSSLSSESARFVEESAKQSYLTAFSNINLIAAVVGLFGLICIIFFLRNQLLSRNSEALE